MNYLFIKRCPPASSHSAGNFSDGSSGPAAQQKHTVSYEVCHQHHQRQQEAQGKGTGTSFLYFIFPTLIIIALCVGLCCSDFCALPLLSPQQHLRLRFPPVNISGLISFESYPWSPVYNTHYSFDLLCAALAFLLS